MVCKNCGKYVADGHNFCPNCGARIQAAPASGSSQKKSGSAVSWIVTVVAVVVLLIIQSGGKTTTSGSSTSVFSSSSASQSKQYIDNAKNYMASGDYHSAVGELIACEDATEDSDVISTCENMLHRSNRLSSPANPRPAPSWSAPSSIRAAANTMSLLKAAPWK